MLKKFIFLFISVIIGTVAFAQDLAYILPQTQPTLQNIQTLIHDGNYTVAKNLLEQAYQNSNDKQEKEEIVLTLAYIATQQEDYNRAIRLYRQILNSNPSITIARFNLAWLYFLKKEYEAARFNMKLALAQKDLPEDMRKQGSYLLYQIRQERVWNAEISVGIAPDTNINGASGKQIECFYIGLWGPFCRELENIQSDVGFQGAGIFDYTYKFNDKWSIKNRLNVDAIHYDDERFSFWSMGLASGPRYTAKKGEYWLAGSYKKQFNEEHRYANTCSVFADISRDLGRRFSLYSKAEFSDITYEKNLYKAFDTKEYSFNTRLFFFLNNWSYLVLGLNYSLDDARADYNSFFRQNYSLGLGMQLPYGFNIYLEPSLSNSHYLHKGFYITNDTLVEEKRKENTKGVFISLSSNLLSVYDFTPRVNFLYNKRSSNIGSYGFERTRWEFGISKAF